MKITPAFTFDKVAHNKENELHMVVSLKAPSIDWQKGRAPICIVPVIDCSGSMRGPRIDYARKSVLKLIDHLRPGDFMGLVGFSDTAFAISPIVEITQTKKDHLKSEVGKLRPMASTNFADGMLMAFDMTEKADLPDGTAVRVIMFTDGHANIGIATSAHDIAGLAERSRKRCTVSAFGYGAGANQELLSELSNRSNGNYAFVGSPEDALSAFGKELGGLISSYANDIVVEISSHNGHRVTKVLTDADVSEEKNSVKIKLADILAEETRNVVVAVKLSEQKQALPRDVNVFDVKVSYSIVDAAGKKQEKTEEIKAKIRFTKPGEEQTAPTKAWEQIVALAELADAQVRAEEHAQRGDYKSAEYVMNSVATNFGTRGLNAYQIAAATYSGSVCDAASYSRSGGYRSSVTRAANRGSAMGLSSMDSLSKEVIGSLNLADSSAAQDAMVTSFTADEASSASDNGVVVTSGDTIVPVPSGMTIGGATVTKTNDSAVSKSKSKRW